jgi:hypothetical protein
METAEADAAGSAERARSGRSAHRRRWLVVLGVVGSLLLMVGAVVGWRVFRVLSTGPAIGTMDSSHLSATDQQLLSQARRLGEQASTIGGNIGGLALSGDSEGVAAAGNKLVDIGHQLIALAAEAQNPGVAVGLRKTGEGTEATGHGVLESSPSQVEQGLALLKAGQVALEATSDGAAANPAADGAQVR